jgi:hypothetical protein
MGICLAASRDVEKDAIVKVAKLDHCSETAKARGSTEILRFLCLTTVPL